MLFWNSFLKLLKDEADFFFSIFHVVAKSHEKSKIHIVSVTVALYVLTPSCFLLKGKVKFPFFLRDEEMDPPCVC